MPELPVYIVSSKGGSLLSVFVQPRAAKDELVGLHGSALKIKVKAAPDQGKANRAACEVLADLIGVPAHDIDVASGAASRHKRIAIEAAPEIVVEAVERVLSSRAPKRGITGGVKEGIGLEPGEKVQCVQVRGLQEVVGQEDCQEDDREASHDLEGQEDHREENHG